MLNLRSAAAAVAPMLLLVQSGLFGQTVKVTPLGSKTGEFCPSDRAMVFEDPTGIRILYDPGSTVAGSGDSRLGAIDVALLSHVHPDHIGSARLNQDPDAPSALCAGFPTAPVVPNSNLAEIIGAKHAAFIGTGAVGTFLSTRIQGLLPSCGSAPSPTHLVVPAAGPCLSTLFFGGKRIVTRAGASSGVVISLVTAKHDNAVPGNLLSNPLAGELAAQGLVYEVGDPAGYVLTFSNGLTVYLSGDTGQTSDMSTIVAQEYKAELAVFNIGDIFTTGPEEAAFAINRLVRPRSVIPSHANEVATSGGKVIAGTRTATFLSLIEAKGYVPLSGQTMQFDAHGLCVGGCR